MEKEYSWKYFQINREKNIIFDSKEVPFLRPIPELSDLGESSSVANEFKRKWPFITFNKACLVDGAILIQDVSSKQEFTSSAKELNSISSITLQIVDGFNLTKNLINLIIKTDILENNPLIIYPGSGSQSVKSFASSIDKRFDNSTNLPTERTMIKNGDFKLSVDYSSLPQRINTKNVLIIDDVVASGQTAQTISFEIKKRFPKIKCALATWLFLFPTKPENINSLSGIDNIDQSITSLALKGNLTSRPPVNSLSCFKRSENKYEEMKANFINKYISSPEEFKNFIKKL